MREILFRGKRKDNGEWVEGFLIGRYDPRQKENIIKRTGIDNGTCFGPPDEVIPETVGQSTGLTDKNGKKIFEGDIVNIEYPDAVVCNTVINYIGASFFGRRFDDDWELDDYVSLEVIGNIHDNPELLSEGE